MKNVPILALMFASIVGMSAAFAYATGDRSADAGAAASSKADVRPEAGTVKCRDAQIFRLRSLLVSVEHNPLSPQDYSQANDTVAELLRHAETLQAQCK